MTLLKAILKFIGIYIIYLIVITLIYNILLIHPILIPPVMLIIIGGYVLASSKIIRDKARKKLKKIEIKGLIFPKNKRFRLVVNVLFILFWLMIWMFFNEIYYWYDIDYDEEFFRFCLIYLFLYAPIFFYTRYLWFEKSRNRIFYGIPEQLFKKFKFNLKQFNTEVFNTTSNADELKKYADLRDQGVITEEEFQAKKKILLDL